MTPKYFEYVCILAVSMLAGCNIVGPLLIFTIPDKTIEPEFTFATDSRVLVLADAMNVSLSRPQFKQRLCQEIATDLVGYGLVKSVVPIAEVESAARKLDRQYAAKTGQAAPLSELLAETGADMAIYMEIVNFRLGEHDGYQLWRPACGLKLRVVDAKGKQLWPEGFSRGKAVSMSLPECAGEDPSLAITLSEQLAAELAEKVVKNFREYKQPRSDF